jgi:hypothetical protein
MSVLVTVKIPCDTEAFRRFADESGDKLVAIADAGKAQGAVHHRFAAGDGFILAVDEWPSGEAFGGFFEGNEKIGEVMAAAGATGEPEVTIGEAIDTPDMF